MTTSNPTHEQMTECERVEAFYAPLLPKLGKIVEIWVHTVGPKSPAPTLEMLSQLAAYEKRLAEYQKQVKRDPKLRSSQVGREFEREYKAMRENTHLLFYGSCGGLEKVVSEPYFAYGIGIAIVRKFEDWELNAILDMFSLPEPVDTNFAYMPDYVRDQPSEAILKRHARTQLVAAWAQEDKIINHAKAGEDTKEKLERFGLALSRSRAGITLTNPYFLAFRRFLNDLAPSSTQEMQERFLKLLVMREIHRRAPRAYEISQGLSEMLKVTNCDRIPLLKVKLPYPLIYLHVPAGAVQVEGVPVMGIYMSIRHYPFTEVPFLVMDFVKETTKVSGASAPIEISFPLRKSETVGSFLLSELQEVGRGKDIKVRTDGQVRVLTPKDQELLLAVRWVFNVLLYLALPSASVVRENRNKEHQALVDRLKSAQGSKREKILGQMKQLSPMYRIVVGKDAQMQHKRVKEPSEKPFLPEGVIPTKIQVPGHWRRMKGYRKWLLDNPGVDEWDAPAEWIEPYYRGPEEGILVEAKHRAVFRNPRKRQEVTDGNAQSVDGGGDKGTQEPRGSTSSTASEAGAEQPSC